MPILLLFICSCDHIDEEDIASTDLFPQPVSYPIKIKEGYTINPVTGDSILPIVNSFGDILMTGVPIPVQLTVVSPDSLELPKVTEAKPFSTAKGYTHRHPIRTPPVVVTIDSNRMKRIPFSAIDSGDTSHYILNSIGQRVQTGIPVPARGNFVAVRHSKPVKASPPRRKEDASTHIKFLDAENGLNSSYILSVIEDHQGHIWMGTDGVGASVYDGEYFRHFTEKDGLPQNIVKSILEDRSGNIWLGTWGGGVCVYNGKKD
ncbi:MAG: hypothetical protein IPN36_15645 [Bacteroidetes bacterium]|nr:hypothetical protein [Bacteroidota bacterium]